MFQFKQLMLQLDPDDPDDEETNKVLTALGAGGTNTLVNPVAATSVLTEADQIALANYKVRLLNIAICITYSIFVFVHFFCFFVLRFLCKSYDVVNQLLIYMIFYL